MRNLSTLTYRLAWTTVLGVALATSAWSLFETATHNGVPVVLACGVSAIFDGSAVLAATIAHRYASSPYSGAGPRLFLVALLSLSVLLNVTHAREAGYGLAAAVLFAAPSVIAVVLHEIDRAWTAREVRRAAGHAPLPRLGMAVWARFPRRSFEALSRELSDRLDALAPPAVGTAPERPEPEPDPAVVAALAALPSDAARVRHAAEVTGLAAPAEVAAFLRRHGCSVELENARTALRRHRAPELNSSSAGPRTNGHAYAGAGDERR